MRLCFLAFCLLASMAACKKPGNSAVKESSDAVSALESPSSQSTVGLTTAEKNNSYFCSGAVVSDRLILTAAHCVEGMIANGTTASLLVAFEFPTGRVLIGVEKIQMRNPKGSLYYPQQDIAWLKLVSPVPEPFKPTPILLNPGKLTTEAHVDITGYGKTKTDCTTTSCQRTLLKAPTRMDSYWDEHHLQSLFAMRGVDMGEGNGCGGFGGGPAFALVDNTWFLVGLGAGGSNRIKPATVLTAAATCESSFSLYTALGDYVNWIETSSGSLVSKSAEAATREVGTGALPEDRTSWKAWLQAGVVNDSVWETVESIQISAMIKSAKYGVKYFTDDTAIKELAESVELFTIPTTWERTRRMLIIGSFLPFAALPRLTTLAVYTTPDVDLAGLKNLTTLTSLNIFSTSLTADFKEVQALESMIGLDTLVIRDFSWEKVADLDLSKLSKLRNLVLVGSNLVVPKLPPGLTTLTLTGSLAKFPERLSTLPVGLINLTINSTDLKGLPTLNGLTKLASLDVNSSNVSDFSSVNTLPSLLSLSALGNPAAQRVCPPTVTTCNYDQIANPKTLMEFCINYMNKVAGSEAYAPIFSFSGAPPTVNELGNDKGTRYCAERQTSAASQDTLTVVAADNRSLNIQVLTQYPKLASLFLKNGSLADVKQLEFLPTLKNLGMENTIFTSMITSLNLPGLESMEIRLAETAEVPGLEMPKLSRFVLDNFKAADLKFLSKYPLLEDLSLRHPTGVTNWSQINSLVGLRRLEIANVAMVDFKEFAALTGVDVSIVSSERIATERNCPIMAGSCEFRSAVSGIEMRRGLPLGLLTDKDVPRVVPTTMEQYREMDLPGF